jgi:phosphatidylglycerol---prolipoprotein diacylglyceryl transferase
VIPCWPQPAFQIAHFTFYAHGILLALGAIVTSVLFVKRARSLSLNPATSLRLLLVLVPTAFLASHLAYVLFDDRTALFELQGINSLGGILVCVPLFALLTSRTRESRSRWLDAASHAALVGASIARLGCFLAHDRLGLRTSSPLSVTCPGGPYYDLALFEMIFLAVFLAFFTWLQLRPERPAPGIIFAVLVLSYGVLRTVLGQLSEPPQRFLGLAPEQWGGVILAVAGALCWLAIKRTPKRQPASNHPS